MSTKAKKPKTEREWCAHRVQLECKVIRFALENPLHPNFTAERRIQYALYGLAGAISELSKQMDAK